jgi:uncharacterized protein YecE (DUF72 family)
VPEARRVFLGAAGWAIPRVHAHHFPAEGTGLERYATRVAAVEINSTFYRTHKPQTLERWASSVPDSFRFAVKVPRAITHERRLVDASEPLVEFLASLAVLGPKLGPLLVQLPPSLAYGAAMARSFFETFREGYGGDVVCEPRHPSWFTAEADALFEAVRVPRVAADPAPCAGAERPGGWPGLAYWRLHGSPAKYRSAYSDQALVRLATEIRTVVEGGASAWCIFDNTVTGAATGDALKLAGLLEERPGSPA